jgi:hypothetical protein
MPSTTSSAKIGGIEPAAVYNSSMSRWGVTVVVLVLVLLGTGGYLVYKVSRAVAGNFTAVSLQNSIFSAANYPPDASQLPAAEAQVRRAYQNYGGWQLGVMLHDLLLLQAWAHPDASIAPLRESMQLGTRYYPELKREGNEWQDFIGSKIAWGYLYAALPQRVDSWGKSYAAATPSAYDSMLLMRINAAIQRDDLVGAQALVAAEVEKAKTTKSNQALAIAACIGIGDLEQARRCAKDYQYSPGVDAYVKHYYAAYLMDQQRFSEAKAIGDELFGTRPDPDDAMFLAAAQAGAQGLDDAEVRRLIETGAGSSRSPRSVAGAEAWVAVYLYLVTYDDQYARRIMALRAAHMDDFEVVCAELECGLYRQLHRLYDDAGQPRLAALDFAGGAALPEPNILAPEVLRLADTPGRRQTAHMLAANVLCLQARAAQFDHRLLMQAAGELRRALGDPGTDNTVATERVADYDVVLLDPIVRQARRADVVFDEAVNHAVVDFLNRRRDLFSTLDPGPALSYRKAGGPEQR